MRKKIIAVLLFTLPFCFCAFSQSAEDYYKAASDLYDKSKYAEAIAIVNKALKEDSANVKYLLLKGNAFEKSKKYQEAFDVYSFGIHANPNDSYLYNQRGVLLIKVQQTEDAIKDFSAALDFENTDSLRLGLLLNRGAAKIDIRDFESAYQDFIEALKIDSLNIATLNNLATVCDEVGKGDQTLKYLYKIIEIDSTFIGAYGNIGFKNQLMGNHQAAIKFFNKVLQLDPEQPIAYNNRAYSKYKLGEYDAALKDVNQSIKMYPSNSYAFRNRALIYIAMKQNAKACADIDEALRSGFTKMYGDEVEELKKKHCNTLTR
jgi:tetratricopeptide (TPR) repeat protein